MHLKRGHITKHDLSAVKAFKRHVLGQSSRSRAEYRWRKAYLYLNKLDGEADVPDPCMLHCPVGSFHAIDSAQIMADLIPTSSGQPRRFYRNSSMQKVPPTAHHRSLRTS